MKINLIKGTMPLSSCFHLSLKLELDFIADRTVVQTDVKPNSLFPEEGDKNLRSIYYVNIPNSADVDL